jgi:hypothetical protein
MASSLPTLTLAVLYTVLFVASWEPDTFRLIMNPNFYFLPQVCARPRCCWGCVLCALLVLALVHLCIGLEMCVCVLIFAAGRHRGALFAGDGARLRVGASAVRGLLRRHVRAP